MTLDPFHPEAIAAALAHVERRGRGCARTADAASRSAGDRRRVACTCTPDPETLAEVWAGRARMAAARAAAGVALDVTDREALARAAAPELGGAA